MNGITTWTRLREWAEYLPIRLAYRIVWFMAKAGSGNARDVYRAMWNAGLNLPLLTARLAQTEGALTPLGEALAGIADDYMTSEKHHPGYVLIPAAKFEQLRLLAKITGDA